MKFYRVSSLERFRQWESDQDAELSDLIADLTGQSEPSPAMLAGTAFHKALELACTGLAADSIEADGYTFRFPYDMEVELSPIRECRAHKVYVVDGIPCAITGQVDLIDGLRVDDHKTTGRFDPDRYLADYKWRLYLEIFGAALFRWNVFEIAEAEAPGVYEVKAAHRLEQYRYPGMPADCEALVARFVRFARDHLEQKVAA